QDPDSRLWIILESTENLGQLGRRRPIHGVAHRRPTEDHRGNGPFFLNAEGHVDSPERVARVIPASTVLVQLDARLVQLGAGPVLCQCALIGKDRAPCGPVVWHSVRKTKSGVRRPRNWVTRVPSVLDWACVGDDRERLRFVPALVGLALEWVSSYRFL